MGTRDKTTPWREAKPPVKPQCKVTIVLSVAVDDIGAFMEAWNDEIRDKLQEQAGIDSAIMEMSEIKQIELPI